MRRCHLVSLLLVYICIACAHFYSSLAYSLVIDEAASDEEFPIHVHLICHTHDDAGWQVSVDEYQLAMVDVILDNVVLQLDENPSRTFTYAETNFFSQWYRRSSDRMKQRVRTVVQRGQLEFVNGGWVQHDEACPSFNHMLDQTTRGHMWLKQHLGVIPNVTWQIDPFGHSNTQAWLLGAKAGFSAVFFGRSDYQELKTRYKERRLEYVWEGSSSLKGSESRVFAGQLFGTGKYGGYYTQLNFEDTFARDRNYVQDDPTLQGYNVRNWLNRVKDIAERQRNGTKTRHQMWMLGNDFSYQSASRWYTNLDKLVRHVNAEKGLGVKLSYSTPSKYVRAVYEETKRLGLKWEIRRDDLFPLADGPHEYWTGYFTSRPAVKKQFRAAAALLDATRQIETWWGKRSLHGTEERETESVLGEEIPLGVDEDSPVCENLRRTTNPVGRGFTDDLEGALAIAAHHDGVSGTARQSVTNDYQHRMALGSKRAEHHAGHRLSASIFGQVVSQRTCNCNGHLTSLSEEEVGAPVMSCLNISTCAFTTNAAAFVVGAWNPLGQTVQHTFYLPVLEGEFVVTHGDRRLPTQLLPLDERTLRLPSAHLNAHGLTLRERRASLKRLENPATHLLVFQGLLPPVGYAAFRVERRAAAAAEPPFASTSRRLRAAEAPAFTVHYLNETDSIVLSSGDGESTYEIDVEWGYYASSEGGCTKDDPYRDGRCATQPSGAYIFRPNATRLAWSKRRPLTTQVVEGAIVTEIRQTFSSWISHVLRIQRETGSVELEYTVGPVPIADGVGKEVVARYGARRRSGTRGSAVPLGRRGFSVDSSGREALFRVRDHRSSPAYPEDYPALHERVASNYYPVTSFLSIESDWDGFAALPDVPQGGSSLRENQLELMVHRRILRDDFRGVEEPLNETMCGCGDINARPGEMGRSGRALGDGGCACVGLVARGSHRLLIGGAEEVRRERRRVAQLIASPPSLWFYTADRPVRSWRESFLRADLPRNVQLTTLSSNYPGEVFEGSPHTLVRFAHAYQVGESKTDSAEVFLKPNEVFRRRVRKLVETTSTGNQPVLSPREERERRMADWPVEGEDPREAQFSRVNHKVELSGDDAVRLRPMEVRTFWVWWGDEEGGK